MSTIPLDLVCDDVKLPPPSLPLGASLELALQWRHSSRAFAAEPLTLEELATVLWAGFGVNRRASGGRTAPSAHNWQEIAVYACLAEGCFRYDASEQRLALVKAQDLREITGLQDFVATVPLNLVYVADFARMNQASDEERGFLAGADAGCIAQNVYLCCAALGLATVVRGLVDRARLATAMGLRPTQRIALAQSVGRPAA
jgi:SagB-type dehydrogenase family enzyme